MKSKETSNGVNNASGSQSSSQVIPLQQLLKDADLLRYHDPMKSVLKLRHAGDLAYTEEKDLSSIGMSRPEQKRLRQAYSKVFPQSGVFVKLRKVFGKGDSRTSDYINTNSTESEEQHVIPVDSIQLCKELGVGEFGHVYLSSWTQNNGEVLQVAVKRVPPEKLIANYQSFLQEAAIMTKMRHENVVRLYGVVLDLKAVMLVSELAPCGSLLECVQKPALRNSFPVDVLCSFGIQIARGMQYLAMERLIHRDLAARNVLVFSAEKVKISDFGLSRSLGVGEDYYKSEFNPSMKLPIAWCAPECINYLKFTEKSDVWSFGVTLWEEFSYGEMPWRGYNGAQILQAIDQNGQRLDCPQACPLEFYTIMQKCWAHNPDDRPTFDELVGCLPSMMPQLLVTIADSSEQGRSLLRFKQDDIIILVNRCPTGSLNGEYWLGAMKDGQIGLFKPADTVAYLGAESPSPGVINFKNTPIVKKKDLKQSKLPPERKKLMISEPQGDVRHTCHVGVDGQSFGLLQVDKNELSKALPPTFPMKIEGDSKIPPRPAPRKLPVSPGTPVRHISSEKNVFPLDLHALEEQAPPLFPRGLSSPPEAPTLPPKPGRNSALVIRNKLPELSPNNSLNRRTIGAEIAAEFHNRQHQLLHHVPDDSITITNSGGTTESSNPESVLDQVLNELQDITKFSVQTNESLDFSDTRPLLNGARPKLDRTSPKEMENGTLTYMDEAEFDSLQKLASEQHKRAEKQLERQRTLEKKASKTSLLKQELEERFNSTNVGSFTKAIEVKKQEEWTPEAQSAYKFLVECGNRLQSTSPVSERSNTASRSSNSSSTTNTELTVIAGTQFCRASAPPESPSQTLERSYENQKIPPVPSAPAVPPKPFMKNKIEAHKVESGFLSTLRQQESVKL
ncbi:hypothetical protein FO519_001497 [Halicephalobus sp. NKZ332]|nr:hypothetical protein FO519_001497 [Halicephalobus sp. NKZ332]